MNYLAHAYLSFGHSGLLAGNMISDFIKGRKKFDYPPQILAGIDLHREIDAFTDSHSAVAMAKEIFRPYYRLYSGAIIDIIFDYYLANDTDYFTKEEHQKFASTVYVSLDAQISLLPLNFLRVFMYMKKGDWLFNYRYEEGIHNALNGIAHRATYMTEGETAFQLFMDNKEAIRICFQNFFPAVKQFAKERIDIIFNT